MPTSPAAEPGSAEPGARSLARNRDFVILWTARAVSEFGTAMSRLVFPLVAYALTGSAGQAGLATGGLVLGSVALRLPAGAWVDRLPRDRALFAANAAAAAVYASLAVALFTGRLTLVHLVLAGVLSGAADAFVSPATSATVRTVVPAAQLPLAYTRLQARDSAVRIVGPPAGGALYSLARGLPFVVDAVSYAVEAVAVTRLRTPLPAPPPSGKNVVGDVRDGLRFVWEHAGVRALMTWGGLANFAGGFVSLAVTLRLVRAGVHPAVIGLVDTAAALAGLAGALVAPVIVSRAPTGLTAIVLTAVSAALTVPLAFTTDPVPVAALAAAVTFLVPANNAGISAYLVSLVPDALQGRVNAAAGFVSGAPEPLAPLLAGVALGAIGGPVTMLLGAALTALTAVPLVLTRAIRELGPPPSWETAQ